MDARDLAKRIEQLINDNIDGSEAYVSSAGGTLTTCTLQVAFDEENELFRIVIQEESG